MKQYPTLLSIAGSDPIGGAGIQADIKTASALGVYAMTAITAITVQNTTGVKGFQIVDPKVIEGQLQAIISDVYPDAVKIGMIPDARTAEIIADFLEKYSFKCVVVDPVMVATSGDSLSEPETLPILKQRIIPKATIITPNLPEAEVLSGKVIRNSEEYTKIAEDIISRLGPKSVLIKGGHAAENGVMTDLFLYQENDRRIEIDFPHPEIITVNTHGTGCTLSSAIASFTALDYDLPAAVKSGIEFLQTALDEGSLYKFGNGHGPVNHLFRNSI